MVANWHSEPVMTVLPNVSIEIYDLQSTFTHAVSRIP